MPVADAGQESPLKPIDTSSPRGTLQGFLEFMNKGYGMGIGLIRSHMDSSKLYLPGEDVATMLRARHFIELAERALDLSELPPAMVQASAPQVVIQLKEVLDRIDLPPIDAVPDAEAMAKTETKRWTIPDSEIRIARVETGPRAGEYLFTAETVKRLPEFFAKVKGLPYHAGASAGWYEFAFQRPAGIAIALHRIVPPKWVLDVPRWARATFLNQPLWRWLGIGVVLGAGLVVIVLCFRLSHYRLGPGTSAARWAGLLRPFSLAIVSPQVITVLADVLRITGSVYVALTLSLWTVFYLALTWMVWAAGGAVAESMIAEEKLLAGSIDSQLIRLVLRLLTIIVAVAILVAGADRVGLPAYSVLAGLGVGGLAVALAAQQTLANLLGSLIIMFEKPFSIGHWIRLKDIEGIVETVGFRSTRIRTFYNSLVTIPSSQLVNSTVDNLELREYRQVKTVLNLTYDTQAGKIEEFLEHIKQILLDHPDTRKDNIQVVLYDFGPHSLDILLNFFLKAPDRETELIERQRILLDILRLAEATDVKFAFPTQTLHIENMPAQNQTIAAHAGACHKDR
jgi:MscS family membrane protein